MKQDRAIKPIHEVLAGRRRAIPPVWLMRQAGRYLPEYRVVRSQVGSFLELCFTPKLAAEVTLQPIRRFGFDAAVLFSDILVVPYALGQEVSFESGEGPRLEALTDGRGLGLLRETIDANVVEPVYEAIACVKQGLAPEVGFLGFCGAPWTVATYMVAGRSTDDQAPARLFAYRDPAGFSRLIEILIVASVEHLVRQFEAGVDAVQIFDSWSGVLSPEQFCRWCVEPMREIVAGVRGRVPNARIIGFPRGAGSLLPHYVAGVPVNAVGLDWSIDRGFARGIIPGDVAVQGNLDPLALVAGGRALDSAVDAVLAAFADAPFIFNLGHGIAPETPIEHVQRMIARVRAYGGGGES